jgi:hypothetical protein
MHIQPSDTKVYRVPYAAARLGLNPSPAYEMALNEKNTSFFDQKSNFLPCDLLADSAHNFSDILLNAFKEDFDFKKYRHHIQKVHIANFEFWR